MLAKVISIYKIIFNKNLIFNRKIKNFINNLIYSIIDKIAIYIKIIKLLLLVY